MSIEYIKENYNRVLNDIEKAAGDRDVTLVCVTKSGTDEELLALAALGVTDIGENRPQELRRRADLLRTHGYTPRLHEIGNLQRGNVKYIVGDVALIHSVDSLPLGERIGQLAKAQGRVVPVLVEVNSAGEEQKGGVSPDGAEALCTLLSGIEGISVRGIMTMGPRVSDPEELRPYFRQTKQLFDRLKTAGRFDGDGILSMGMSSSFAVAIEEGATLVRVGTRLFEN